MSTPSRGVAPDSPGAVLQLIRSGEVSSRARLAKHLGVSASTAGLRVQALIDHGYVRETADGQPQGGRRPRRLALRQDFGEVVAVDLGSHHATVARFDMSGTLVTHLTKDVRIAEGPDEVLGWVHAMLADSPARLRGVTIGVPGPVDARTGRVVSPSRMPGWNRVRVASEMTRYGPPATVLVDNDANLMALGEHSAEPVDHMVFVKAGAGIGCGVIASGRLHRGSAGAAGDISHLPVPGREDVECSCGRNGCLEAVASGAALVRDLNAAGVTVGSPAEVVALAGDAEPTATRLLREAGRATGELLATVVNFFNPDALVIGGQLGRAEPFVASVRAAVFERCLPMATERLQVRASRTGYLAGVTGGARLVIEHLLDPERVNEAIEKS
ncbi:ROK family transcriptional regulator [Actinophytocola oryzae]|uniref:Putative NBD/HSP70 family sugar kinase n=1 Tax=Actinophytocola oryzae TaxID=502181 RepID=A0A4R7V5Q2_9PSEU|nr:ROK family transcriptional regulator [Actinophytocola oryzae]TDV44808.1 putative NBD/HSP70 family sugar kinase [Actinophytocola oryzae]